MADQNPQDQPQQNPGQDWNEVSVQEMEQTLSSAADLAYELAGDVGVTPNQPRFRDTSGIESIETTLDGELKQLEHLVGKTQEQLSDDPPPAAEKPKKAAAIPDFMSEFLSDEPVTVVPEPRALQEAAAEDGPSTSRAGSGSVSADVSPTPRGQALETTQKAGLVGVGSLGRETKKAPKIDKAKTAESAKPAHRASWPGFLEGPLYQFCNGAIGLLEVANRPFAKLGPTTQRALSVTAIAAFCVCLAMFVLSLMMS
jgi:hypothetical protein